MSLIGLLEAITSVVLFGLALAHLIEVPALALRDRLGPHQQDRLSVEMPLITAAGT
jgi:hypothetical protein